MPFTLLVLLSAAPVKVAALAPNAVGIAPTLAEAMVDRLATQLASDGDIVVTSASDVRQVLGAERNRQLLGCDETSSSCMAELVAALGVDLLLTTTFAQTGKSISVTLRVLNSASAATIVQETYRAADAEALQDWLDGAKNRIGNGIRRAVGRPELVTSAPSPVPWVVGAASLGAGIGAVALLVVSNNDSATLRTSSQLTLTDIESLQRSATVTRWTGVGLAAAAGIGMASAIILLVAAPTASQHVSFDLTPINGGAYTSVRFTW